MTKVLALAGAAVSALVLTTAFSQAELNYEAAKRLNLMKIVGCNVAGSPSEFPDDIKIINKGFGPLVAGTKVKWSVPSAGKAGVYTLGAGLAAGQAVVVSGVLGAGIEAGRPCTAKFI
jgi:hypothetical protein